VFNHYNWTYSPTSSRSGTSTPKQGHRWISFETLTRNLIYSARAKPSSSKIQKQTVTCRMSDNSNYRIPISSDDPGGLVGRWIQIRCYTNDHMWRQRERRSRSLILSTTLATHKRSKTVGIERTEKNISMLILRYDKGSWRKSKHVYNPSHIYSNRLSLGPLTDDFFHI